jgi:Transport protein particle (TRAPP) component
MIIDNDPPVERHISVPRDMSQLSCSSFTAGIVEAVLDGLSFVCDAFLPKANLQDFHFAARPSHCTQHANFTISQSDNYIDQT